MLHALAIGATLAVAHPHWLYAHTGTFLGEACLAVYRNPILKDTNPMYLPVLDFLMKHETTVIHSDTVPDKDMMFGSGDLTIYRLEAIPNAGGPLTT